MWIRVVKRRVFSHHAARRRRGGGGGGGPAMRRLLFDENFLANLFPRPGQLTKLFFWSRK